MSKSPSDAIRPFTRRRADNTIDEVLGRVGHLCERFNDLSHAQAQTMLLLQQHITDSAKWREKTDAELASNKAELASNTEATEVVRNVITAGRKTSKFALWFASSTRTIVVWLGGLAAGAYGIWQLVVVWLQGGPGNGGGGIGPVP